MGNCRRPTLYEFAEVAQQGRGRANAAVARTLCDRAMGCDSRLISRAACNCEGFAGNTGNTGNSRALSQAIERPMFFELGPDADYLPENAANYRKFPAAPGRRPLGEVQACHSWWRPIQRSNVDVVAKPPKAVHRNGRSGKSAKSLTSANSLESHRFPARLSGQRDDRKGPESPGGRRQTRWGSPGTCSRWRSIRRSTVDIFGSLPSLFAGSAPLVWHAPGDEMGARDAGVLCDVSTP